MSRAVEMLNVQPEHVLVDGNKLPRWRYRFGLSTDWRERVSCSHGGPMLCIELADARPLKLWPRSVQMRTLWLGVPDRDALIGELAPAMPARKAA